MISVRNDQLIKYSDDQIEDVSVIEDPASVEFTQITKSKPLRLTNICPLFYIIFTFSISVYSAGMKPKYDRSDVLPLVLKMNEEDPEDVDIPPELILEISIEHPDSFRTVRTIFAVYNYKLFLW